MNHKSETNETLNQEYSAPNSARAQAQGLLGCLKAIQRGMQGLAFGVLLQAAGCTFDTEAFVADTLAALTNNIATTFIITALSDLLNVAPAFGF